MVRGMIGLGIPEIEAKRYEGKIKEGNILISVHTESSEQIATAKRIFKNAKAHDICDTGEAGVPRKDKADDRDDATRTHQRPVEVSRTTMR